MELLAPWTAISAAALAVPALLALYFLKLRRRPVRVSTIQFWPKASDDVQANVPLRMMRASWLLLLHLVILGLLIVAIGRPVVQGDSAVTSRVILLIDRSASMNALDMSTSSTAGASSAGAGTDLSTSGAESSNKGLSRSQSISRLEAAKQRAKALVSELRRSVGQRQFAVVTFAAEASGRTTFTSSARTLTDAIDAITPTDEPGNLKAAFALIEALATPSALDEAAGNEPVTVYVIGDGSYAGLPEGSIAGTRIRFERIGPKTVQIVTPQDQTLQSTISADAGPTPIESYNNFGIVGMAAKRDYKDPAMLRIFVEVLNATGAAATVGVTLSVDGGVVDRRALRIAALDENARGPGRTSVIFERPTALGGIVVARLEVTDILEADNAATLIVPDAKVPTIALVRPDPAITSADAGDDVAGLLLQDALAEMRVKEILDWRAVQVEAMLADTNARTATAWPDVVIFDRVTPTRMPPVASVHFGGLPNIDGVRLIDDAAERSKLATGLTRSGAVAGGTALPARPSGGIVLWKREHPVMRDVTLDALRVGLGTRFAIEQSRSNIAELARTSEGPVIIAIEDADAGRARDTASSGSAGPRVSGVERIAVAFSLAESNWPVQASFPIFLANTIDTLTLRGEEESGRAFRAGEAAAVSVVGSSRTSPREIIVKGAATAGTDLRVDVPATRNTGTAGNNDASSSRAVALGRIERAGLYRVEGARERAIAVNMLDATESALASPARVQVDGVSLKGIETGSSEREIWTWLLIAAAVLLCIEWLVYARKARA